VDRDAERMLNCGNWRGLLGGGGLKRPRPQLGCSTTGGGGGGGEEEEEEEDYDDLKYDAVV
jgi:hypothetical protein